MKKIIKKNKTTPDRALDSIWIESKALSGYAVLELLFYIAFFITLSLVVIEAMITMARSFKETSIYAELTQNGSIMERMSREIRAASSIVSISATDLKINEAEFKLLGSNLQLFEDDVFIGNLNTPNIAITALVFTEIITAKGKAVKISLTLRDNNDIQGRLLNFYNTVTLRGDY